ncbi:MAG: hypothetical protein HZC28_02085 [Spirochaetes bacterium]|nr:hypothetical protein [Spirochaetota bacterium]
MKKNIFRFITVMSACAALTASGGTAFEFLSVPDGTFTGLGGTGAAAQGCIEGVFNNPASLASIRDVIRGAGSWSFLPEAGLASLAGSYSPVRNHVIALGVKYLSYNALEGDMTFDNNFTPSQFSASSLYAAASYGIALGDIFAKLLTFPIRFDLGATLGFARESFDNAALSAVLADAGIIVSLFDRHLALGGVLKHAGGMLDGSTTPPLPLSFTAGISGNIDLAPGYALNLFADSDFASGSFGIEAVLLRYAYIRAGLYVADRQTDISGGVGCLIPGGIPVHIDYSFAVSAIGVRHNIGAQVSFETMDNAPAANQK